jgi:hypothetical protein
VPAKVAPNVMPGQVIVYNGWEPYMFRNWRGPMDIEPGLVKWLHLAGGRRARPNAGVAGDVSDCLKTGQMTDTRPQTPDASPCQC